jgi:hypothetical protein
VWWKRSAYSKRRIYKRPLFHTRYYLIAKYIRNAGRSFEQKFETTVKQHGFSYTNGYEVLTMTGKRKIDGVEVLWFDKSGQPGSFFFKKA